MINTITHYRYLLRTVRHCHGSLKVVVRNWSSCMSVMGWISLRYIYIYHSNVIFLFYYENLVSLKQDISLQEVNSPLLTIHVYMNPGNMLNVAYTMLTYLQLECCEKKWKVNVSELSLLTCYCNTVFVPSTLLAYLEFGIRKHINTITGYPICYGPLHIVTDC